MKQQIIMQAVKSVTAKKLNQNNAIEEYQSYLLKAVLRACGAVVIEVDDQSDQITVMTGGRTTRRSNLYTRDPVILLAKRSIALSVAPFSASANVFMPTLAPYYKQLEIVKGAYFEGGNVIISEEKNILLHGVTPTGFYPVQVDPTITNAVLAAHPSTQDLKIVGISLNPVFLQPLDFNATRTRKNFYYHLDCFMQLLPDGHLILLNKNILAPDSFTLLHELFGEQLVDLAYTGWYDAPLILNFVCVVHHETSELSLIASTLPDEISRKFKMLGYRVITPASLEPNHSDYNDSLSLEVSQHLRTYGFNSEDHKKLVAAVPCKHEVVLHEQDQPACTKHVVLI